MVSSNEHNARAATEILKKARVEVSPEVFTVLSLDREDWFALLARPELSPRMTVPYLIFQDKWEVTLVLDETDFAAIEEFVAGKPAMRNYRLMSFDADLDLEAVGFIAKVAQLFADADVAILPFASFTRDHVLIAQKDLARALKALRGHVAEIC